MNSFVTKLYCATCDCDVFVLVGKHKSDCVNRQMCKNCQKRYTIWRSVLYDKSFSSYVFIADEREV
jgi:hypothetical protein